MTSEIINTQNVLFDTLLPASSFTVAKGTVTVIKTTKEEVDNYIARLLLGFIKPAQGKISVLGIEPSLLPEAELPAFRQRIGLVYANGGLISNLKIWENVILPLTYMNQLTSTEIEKQGMAVLHRLGYTGRFMQLPGHTPFHQKKIAGFARAMLMDPELMVYESPLQGLNQDERTSFVRIAQEFHWEKEGRTSLFISSNPELIPKLEDATVISIS